MNKEYYLKKIKDLEFELLKYKESLKHAQFDFFDINFETGEAFQSEYIGSKMGYEKSEIDTYEKRNSIFHAKDLQVNLSAIEDIKNGDAKKVELLSRAYGKVDGMFWLKMSGTLCVNPLTRERHFVGVIQDVTQEQNYLKSLKDLANFDTLTDTYNRRSGMKKLGNDMNSNTNVKVVYFDFNDFKLVNDTYGHETGDRVLMEFSEIVKSSLPLSSYLIRLGGDEFLTVFIGQTNADIKDTVSTICNTHIYYGENMFKMSYSFGIVNYDKNKHKNIESLIHNADQEMYRYKYQNKDKS